MTVEHHVEPVVRARSPRHHRAGSGLDEQSSRKVLVKPSLGLASQVPEQSRSNAIAFSNWPISQGLEPGFPDNITARRNVLAALWAGMLMGLAGDDLTAFSHRDRKLTRMIEHDLRQHGVSLSTDEVERAFSRFHRIALHQAGATD